MSCRPRSNRSARLTSGVAPRTTDSTAPGSCNTRTASTVLGVLHLGQRAVVPSCLAVLASCAPAIGYRAPGSVRGYDILVTRKDSLSREIGRGLKRRGYSVRSAVKGGSAPAAYLLWF